MKQDSEHTRDPQSFHKPLRNTSTPGNPSIFKNYTDGMIQCILGFFGLAVFIEHNALEIHSYCHLYL